MHHDPLSQKRELSICQSLLAELTRQVTLPTENGHAAPPVESRMSCQSVNPYCVSEPSEFSSVEAPLLGGAHVDILQNWDSIDCRRVDHLTLF